MRPAEGPAVLVWDHRRVLVSIRFRSFDRPAYLVKERVGADQQPDAQLERTEMRHLVSDALKCLPERERKILTLYYEKELTLKEISVVIRDTLEENGCSVVEAENGFTALERCAAHDGPIQLLVTDMMMPGMNGHDLAERIVRLRPDTPVLFVSGHPEAEVGDNTLIGRKVSLLRKPFSSDELVERVIEVVRSSDRGALVGG